MHSSDGVPMSLSSSEKLETLEESLRSAISIAKCE